MDTRDFEGWLVLLDRLTHGQRERVQQALNRLSAPEQSAQIIQTRLASDSACPHCGAMHLHRYGQAHGLQRYRCTACGKTFNALTGTPLARLRHKAKWLDYLQCMLDSKTIRQAAAANGVHRNTSFRWRHRFLKWIKDDRPTHLHGITEADETYLLESDKGAFHVQNVNAYHSRLHLWLARFHGVATRYLPNYLGWRRALDTHRLPTPQTLLQAALGVFPHSMVT